VQQGQQPFLCGVGARSGITETSPRELLPLGIVTGGISSSHLRKPPHPRAQPDAQRRL